MRMIELRRRPALLALAIGGLLATDPLPVQAGSESDARSRGDHNLIQGELLPTGMRITPKAAPGAIFESLNPDLPNRPDYLADHAVSAAIDPSGTTMLVLTSGYNRNSGANGQRIADESQEYVFVYDISGDAPVKKQVVKVPNSFHGIVWHPDGATFYVAGGVDDNVHVYKHDGMTWAEDGAPIPLGHNKAGLGLGVQPMAAGLAINGAGNRLLVTNHENDSVSLINTELRAVIAELDLRPGKINPAQAGVPGGSYPFAVAFAGDGKAYVSSPRDREIVVLSIEGDALAVTGRIKTKGQPTAMILNGDQTRLYVACDNSDTVAVVDTSEDEIDEEIETTAPSAVFPNAQGFKGSNSNNLALSPDEGTLFVTNGGTNTVAVIQLAGTLPKPAQKEEDDEAEEEEEAKKARGGSHVLGLIPTGWYPNAVAVSADGAMLYVVNGKSDPGANPSACRDTLSIAPGALNNCTAANQYVWQLEKAGLLSVPTPDARKLARLTWQSAYNNNFPTVGRHRGDASMMAFLRQHIRHVIYVVKENRTYDQVLGDLEVGNGDPSLAVPAPYSPNHRRLASQFVTFDSFHDSGETSNTGWNWTTAARSTDLLEKVAPVNYAGRGLSYEAEGTNRNINVGLATLAERQAANPATPSDPDLLPGTADLVAPDAPEEEEAEAGTGYLWDSALRARLTVRNYGFYGDLARYSLPPTDPNSIPLSRQPHADGVVQFFPTKQSLMDITDLYFRGYDMKYPDYWRFKEWEREFDAYVANGNLPNLSLVRLPRDHFGDFGASIDGTGTVETQMAEHDYAVGLLIEKVANSRYKDDTLIFVIEDDAQNGPDHMSARRSIGYIAGPYVKQGVVISTHYTTVSMLRTIEDVLDIEPLGLNDGLAQPMADAFDRRQKKWSYKALVPEILASTGLPIPTDVTLVPAALAPDGCFAKPKRTPAYWDAAMAGQNFAVEDKLDTPLFNAALWSGLAGEAAPFPTVRHGSDMSGSRQQLLDEYKAKLLRNCTM